MPYPSLREIKVTLQPEPAKETVWYAKAIIRKFSAIFTFFLIRTPLTANQATIIQALLGMAGCVVLAFAPGWWMLLGIGIIQLGYIFDCVDGEIARFRKKPTINGIFLDSLNHAVIIPSIFLGLGIATARLMDWQWLLYVGMLLGLLASNPVKHGMLTTMFYLIERKNDPKYSYQGLSQEAGVTSEQSAVDKPAMRNGYYLGNKTLGQQLFNWAKALSEYPASMNVVSLAVFVDLILITTTTLRPGILMTITLIGYTGYLGLKEMMSFKQIYTKRRVEREFLKIISPS